MRQDHFWFKLLFVDWVHLEGATRVVLLFVTGATLLLVPALDVFKGRQRDKYYGSQIVTGAGTVAGKGIRGEA